jgi:putative GTP pyrophosphokinase
MNETEFLARWKAEREIYAAWGGAVVSEIVGGLGGLDNSLDASVFFKIAPTPRLKHDDSLLGKAFHRNKQYVDPYLEIEDKVGVRFVVLLTSDVGRLQKSIEASTKWTWSLDKDYEEDRELRPLEFAYQSKHYVLRAKGGVSCNGVDVPEGTPCEIQLRTLLQHAHSELTHDNIYKVQSGTVVSNSVHRTVAKSMALIEAVDDFFERAIEQLGEATAGERSALKSLSQLFEKYVGLSPGSDKSNSLVLHALRNQITSDLHAQVEAMLQANLFIASKIKERYGSVHAFRQPWILFAYLEVKRHPSQTQDCWPLTPAEILPVFTDLGMSMR